MTLSLRIAGDTPATIEKVMMFHVLMTMAMDADDDCPIIMHYKRDE
tara:strand:+ start:157 stop:294 length:138 start_codon:yes stop_codon:yes gene_type:complete